MNIITGNFVSAAMERSQSVKDPGTTGIRQAGSTCRVEESTFQVPGSRIEIKI